MNVMFKKSLAEFIGTFALVFAGCGAIMVSERFPGSLAPGAVPIIFGLVVSAMVYSVGHISGAHFNPAVTLAFAVGKHFPRRELLSYWSAQFLGGICASAFLWLLLPQGNQFGATIPSLGMLQSFGWEIILSFLLMFVIVSVATDARAVGTMAGAAIGATVTLAAFIGGPVTGASMNPARSLGPALFEGQINSLWIYFLAPSVGAVLASVTYNFIRCDLPSKTTKEAKGCC